jgi:hypothetical protein
MNLSGLGYPDQRLVPAGWQWPVGIKRLERPRWPQSERLYQLAQAVPTLDLQFAATRSLVDNISGRNLITFTRASSATFVGSDGILKTAATNEPRFDHNPTTGESLGLLVEEQRTNGIRNNTMVGAVAGTPGTLPTNWSAQLSGLTQTVVGVGTSDGVSYIDIRLNGTTATNFFNINIEGQSAIAAINGQAWAGSAWLAVVGGSTANVNFMALNLNQWSAAAYLSAVGGSNRVPAISSTLTRITDKYTTNNASIAFAQLYLGLSCATGAAIDITLRIGLPQLEQGAFATSVIPTTTAAATRAADVASITSSAFSSWYRRDEGTVFAQCAVAQPATGSNQFVFRLADNTYNNQQVLHIDSSGFGALATAAGGVYDGLCGSASAFTANTVANYAGAYAANNLGLSFNGATPVADTTATMPTTVNRLDIGSDHNGANRIKAGTIRRLTYWPARLPNITLQRITQ